MKTASKRRAMPPDVVIAEASAWIVRMNSAEKTAADQSAFKEWLRADSAHAHAYELASRMWETIPRVVKKHPIGVRSRVNMAAILIAACAVVASLTLFVLFPRSGPSYGTAIGEQRIVILSDGTKVTLNTDTALSTHYTNEQRLVYLNRGEALFEVTKNPRKPFIVEAAGERVRATGTTFVVRIDPEPNRSNSPQNVAVTLIEGRVEVEPVSKAMVRRVAVLEPGQRAVVHREEVSVAQPQAHTQPVISIDQPKVNSVAAWRRGDVVFEDVSMADAIKELHRYGGPEVKFQDPVLEALRVSGVFGLHDIAESVTALAEVHHLRLRPTNGGLMMERERP